VSINSTGQLYFAYGSNLCRRQMFFRSPLAVPVAALTLTGYRLIFVGERVERWGRGGVATLIPEEGHPAYGAIYRLSHADEIAMDRFEGVSKGQYIKVMEFCSWQGQSVMAYLASRGEEAANKPNQRYLDTLREGYRDWKLPLEALDNIPCYPENEL
jgi:hypothetical protein